MFQIQRSPQIYDVVIIGSGAGGGTVTKVLTDMGISVALLEAGPMLDPSKDYKEHMWPYQVSHRGTGEGGAAYFGRNPYNFGYFTASFGGWQLEGEPYTVAPGNQFDWFRSRILGGRTNHYGRISLRFSDYDFKPYTRDSLGTDWPLSYDDMSPYYDKAGGLHRRDGHQGGHAHARRTGTFCRRSPPRVHESLMKRPASS